MCAANSDTTKAVKGIINVYVDEKMPVLSSMKRWVKIVATLVALGVIYHAIDRRVFWDSILSVNPAFLAVAILLFFPIQGISAYRWYFILSSIGEFIPFWTVVYHSVLGQFSALLLPGQVSGDVVKLLSASRGRHQKGPIVLSVVIDKLALLLSVAIFVFAGVFAAGPVSGLAAVHRAALICVVVIMPVFMFSCRYRTREGITALRLFRGLPRILEKWLLKIVDNLVTLPQISGAAVAGIILSALGLLCLYSAGAYFIALAMEIRIDVIDWLALNAMVSFVQIFPVTIGGLGIREGTFGILLSLYGVAPGHAVAFSITAFVLGAILTSLSWLGLSLIEHANPSS